MQSRTINTHPKQTIAVLLSVLCWPKCINIWPSHIPPSSFRRKRCIVCSAWHFWPSSSDKSIQRSLSCECSHHQYLWTCHTHAHTCSLLIRCWERGSCPENQPASDAHSPKWRRWRSLASLTAAQSASMASAPTIRSPSRARQVGSPSFPTPRKTPFFRLTWDRIEVRSAR